MVLPLHIFDAAKSGDRDAVFAWLDIRPPSAQARVAAPELDAPRSREAPADGGPERRRPRLQAPERDGLEGPRFLARGERGHGGGYIE